MHPPTSLPATLPLSQPPPPQLPVNKQSLKEDNQYIDINDLGRPFVRESVRPSYRALENLLTFFNFLFSISISTSTNIFIFILSFPVSLHYLIPFICNSISFSLSLSLSNSLFLSLSLSLSHSFFLSIYLSISSHFCSPLMSLGFNFGFS